MLCGCVLKFKLLATAWIVFLYLLANIEVILIIHNRKMSSFHFTTFPGVNEFHL